MEKLTNENRNCDKCTATWLTPVYVALLDLIWLQCKCGYGKFMKPTDSPED